MMLIFSLLLVAGLIPMMLAHRQQKRLWRLQRAAATRRSRVRDNGMRHNPFIHWLKRGMNDMRFHLLGEQRSTAVRHGIVLLLVQLGGMYVNQNT